MGKHGETWQEKLVRLTKHVPGKCWEWMGGKNSNGYGVIHLGGGWDPVLLAHRAAWMLAHGAIPAGMIVMHSCDNPGCVNPAHLLVGTVADNMHDRDNRGRCRAGKKALAPVQVHEVCDFFKAGVTIREIAEEYGVTGSTIWDIVRGHSYRKVPR